MRKHEIKIGGVYTARVSGRLTTVRVEAIRERGYGTTIRNMPYYDVTNLATGRRLTFRSAAKFRKEDTRRPSCRTCGRDVPLDSGCVCADCFAMNVRIAQAVCK